MGKKKPAGADQPHRQRLLSDPAAPNADLTSANYGTNNSPPTGASILTSALAGESAQVPSSPSSSSSSASSSSSSAASASPYALPPSTSLPHLGGGAFVITTSHAFAPMGLESDADGLDLTSGALLDDLGRRPHHHHTHTSTNLVDAGVGVTTSPRLGATNPQPGSPLPTSATFASRRTGAGTGIDGIRSRTNSLAFSEHGAVAAGEDGADVSSLAALKSGLADSATDDRDVDEDSVLGPRVTFRAAADATAPSLRSRGWRNRTWQERLRYMAYYFPVSMWLPSYNWRESIVPDLVAGLSVGFMIIPQGIAYADLVGVTPLNAMTSGFWSALIYFFLGNSRILSVGPEATTSILIGQAVLSSPEVSAAQKAGLDTTALCAQGAATITIMTGLLSLLFGLLRFGFVDAVFSRPVLAGFVFAVGMQLILDQMPKLLGIPGTHEEMAIPKIKHLWEEVVQKNSVHWPTILIGIVCIAFFFGFAALKKRNPNHKVLQLTPQVLVCVMVATLISYLGRFEDHGVRVLGSAAGGFPGPRVPEFSSNLISRYFSSALTLAVLGFVETQLVNKSVVLKDAPTISPNRELIALGACHLIAGIFGGYSSFGSLTRTKVAQAAGARSQVYGVIVAFILVITMVAMLPLFHHMPTAVTGALIFYVGSGILETHELFMTFAMKQWVDFALNIAMIFITFFFGVDTGIFFAFGACLLLVVRQQNKPAMRLLGRIRKEPAAGPTSGHSSASTSTSASSLPSAGGPASLTADSAVSPRQASMSVVQKEHSVAVVGDEEGAGSADPADPYFELDQEASIELLEGIVIYQIDGPLFFSNAEGLKERTRRVENFGSVVSHPSEPIRELSLKGIIFDFTAVTSIDSTAAQVIYEIVRDYKSRGVRVIIVKMRRALESIFEAAGLFVVLGRKNLMRSLDQAVQTLQNADITSPAAVTVTPAAPAATAPSAMHQHLLPAASAGYPSLNGGSNASNVNSSNPSVFPMPLHMATPRDSVEADDSPLAELVPTSLKPSSSPLRDAEDV